MTDVTHATEVEVHRDGYPTHRRKPRFDWSDTPLHWVPDDPFSTHMMNVLHLLLPTAERWFVKVVDEAAPMVDDPELKAAIKPFIQQEAWHAWAHQVVLDHLAGQGIDTKPYIDKLQIRLQKTMSPLGNKPTNWPRPLQRWSLYSRLAAIAALEHFNIVLGEWMIQNRGLDYAGADPMMLDLLRWHGAEEIEHRCLVFDLYQSVCGNYPLRALSMLFAAPEFIFWWLAGVRYLMANDPTIDATPRLRDWLGAARHYRVPGPWKLLVTVPGRYLRPSHHPSEEASTQMAMDYLEHSPAARAARESAEAHQRSEETNKQPDAAGNETEKAEG
jgi:predicted metal-dependent hydrolase